MPNETGLLELQVWAMTMQAEGIATFELRSPKGVALPTFTAGSHIDIHLGEELVRQYSLCNDPAESHRYLIGVQRENQGRGGSRAMHETLRIGGLIRTGVPRNHFPLMSGASQQILLAGGIGITPMMSMLHQLRRDGSDYRLHYCTRTPRRTAFLDQLQPLIETGNVHIHHDDGDPTKVLDLSALLHAVVPDAHVYYCGPSGFMRAAAAATANWPRGSVHFEHFEAPEQTALPSAANTPFTVRLVRSNLQLEVPADRTIVEVLREHDVFIDTSCEEGYCGTCLTRIVDGVAEHRDSVLDDEDRKHYMLVCCGRAKTPVLTLDL